LVEIWKESQSAILYFLLIMPVFDITFSVVVFRFVKRVDLAEIITHRSNMIGYYIHHHEDVSFVAFIHQVFEILVFSKVRVSLLPVFCPVTMVASFHVVHNR